MCETILGSKVIACCAEYSVLMDGKHYATDFTSDEDDDWCLISETGPEDLDSAFHFPNSSEFEFITERCFDLSEAPVERKTEEEEREEADNKIIKIGEANSGASDNYDSKAEEEPTEKTQKKCNWGKLLLFHENHYSIPQDGEIFFEEDPFINLSTDHLETTKNDTNSNLINDELICMVEEEGLKESKIYAKVQEVDDFWLKYEYWDSVPSVQKIRRKHKRMYRRRKLMWKRNPPFA